MIYPEFSDVDNALIEYYISVAKEISSCSKNAVYALTAHFIALRMAETGDNSGGSVSTVGTVKKIKVGRVETEYQTMSGGGSDSFYESTPYGKTYLALIDACKKRYVGRVR